MQFVRKFASFLWYFWYFFYTFFCDILANFCGKFALSFAAIYCFFASFRRPKINCKMQLKLQFFKYYFTREYICVKMLYNFY